jgi:hypothetical protein
MTFLAVVLALSIPNSAMAKEKYISNPTKLKAGVWGKATAYTRYQIKGVWTSTYHMLQITVPKDGYIILDAKNTTSIYIANAKKNKEPKHLYTLNGAKKYYVALTKGSYYIYSYSDVKVKYSTKAVASATNTSKAKAKKIKSATSTVITYNETPKKERWYCFDLDTSKIVSFTLKLYASEDSYGTSGGTFSVYDSAGNEVYSAYNSHNKTNKYKTDKLSKGTYYVKFEKPSTDSSQAKTIEFSWK